MLFAYRLPFSLAPFVRRARNQLLYFYLPLLYLISFYDISNPLTVWTVTPRVTGQLVYLDDSSKCGAMCRVA